MNPPVNLTNCDTEPIHIPGSVQSHGFLVTVDANFNICYLSVNAANFVAGADASLLGKDVEAFEQLLPMAEAEGTIRQLIAFARKSNSFDQVNPYKVPLSEGDFYLIIGTADDKYLLEFERVVAEADLDLQRMIGRSVSEMLADKNLQKLLNNSARQIKQIIGYDRVMIYRFAGDGHGEVIAEERNADLESWLGLHYPASDIPQQARELYRKNLTRIIADVHTTPAAILAISKEAGPLDLTCSQLRAVSPMHIQYLKNMGVASSFSISLLYKGELWGLIACHNYTPRFIDYKARESSKLVGQILSSALEFRQDEENQQLQDGLFISVERLSKFMLQSNSIEDALMTRDITLLDVTHAKGAALIYEKNVMLVGQTPDIDFVAELLEWIKESVTDPVYYTNEVERYFEPAKNQRTKASGIMVLTLSKEMHEYIVWFKPEQLQHITWAGNPEKQSVVAENGMFTISPRESFAAWSQTVTGKSELWGKEEIKAVMRLKEEVTYAISQKANAIRQLNEKLKLAYEELDTFSFTISHDLKNPLSVIKSYSQLLTRDSTLKPESQKVIDKIIGRANDMNYMINEVLEYSRIGRSELSFNEIDMLPVIQNIVKDISVVYLADELDIQVGDTPAIKGDAVMIMQVFANLISNAVKYSSKTAKPSIFIGGEKNETGVRYQVKDNGIGIHIQHLPHIFELFNRAANVQDIEGSGVGLAIVKRIVEKHRGKIWVDSEPGNGSTFYVEFRS